MTVTSPIRPHAATRAQAERARLQAAPIIAAIDASLHDHPELALYYRDTLHPAESYVQTVLANDPAIRVRDDDGRRWRSERPIGPGSLDPVLASGADFAGPFEPAALDEVDARVHRRDPS